MFSSFMKKVFANRAQTPAKGSDYGDFEVEYLVGEGEDFDLGVNYGLSAA